MRTRIGNLTLKRGSALPELRYGLGLFLHKKWQQHSRGVCGDPLNSQRLAERSVGVRQKMHRLVLRGHLGSTRHICGVPEAAPAANRRCGTIVLYPSFVLLGQGMILHVSKISRSVMAAQNSIPDLNVAVKDMMIRTAVKSPLSYNSFSMKYADGRETPWLELGQAWDKIDNRYHKCSHSCWPRRPHHHNNRQVVSAPDFFHERTQSRFVKCIR